MKLKTIEDLIQNTLLIVFEKYRNKKIFESGILPYAYTVFRNEKRGDWRQTNRHEELEESNQESLKLIHGSDFSLPAEMDELFLHETIIESCTNYSDREKAILFGLIEGLTREEMRQKTGQKRSALDTAIHRFREKLRIDLKAKGAI